MSSAAGIFSDLIRTGGSLTLAPTRGPACSSRPRTRTRRTSMIRMSTTNGAVLKKFPHVAALRVILGGQNAGVTSRYRG